VYLADTSNHAVRVLEPSASGLVVNAVVNGASNVAGPIAPGLVIVLYGSGLGPADLAQGGYGENARLPTTLAGTTVFVNGAAAPLLYSSAGQVGAIVPFEVAGPTAQVMVLYQGRIAAPSSVNVAQAAPAIFTSNGRGRGPAVAVNQDGSLNDSARAARAGEVITLFVTGAGQTTPPGQNGAAGAQSQVNLPVTATIGGRAANIRYAGGSSSLVSGVIQVNMEVPAGIPAGEVPLLIQVGGLPTQTGVTVWVQ
jgi:uncharacterized protein (TIGR03437 family)